MNSPYQFLPIGTKENLAKFSANDLKKFYADRVMHAPRVLAIYGDVDADKAKKAATQYFGSGSTVQNIKSSSIINSAITEGSVKSKAAFVEVDRVEIQKTDQPLAGVMIGYDSSSVIGDPANYPLGVANTMSSGFGYPTGYLFETLRGLGLVYDVHAINWMGRHEKLPGTFFVFAGCDPEKVNQVIDLSLLNIARLQGTDEDMQPEWFARSKELMTTSDALEHETPSAQATQAALDELYGLGYDYHDEFPVRINAVRLDQIRSIAQQRLTRCIVTVSTPAPNAVAIKPGRRTFDSFPPVDLTPHGVKHDVNK
jgi:zinc protease